MRDLYREFKFVIVGSGLFGATLANLLADAKIATLVLEKRNHVAGNAFSHTYGSSGIEVHKYGSHIFHTNIDKIWNYINQFSTFNSYVHKVTTLSKGQRLPIPINLETLELVLGKSKVEQFLNDFEKRAEIEQEQNSKNLKEWATLKVGNELYERVIAGYTQKQWGIPAELLPSSIIQRLPIRTNLEDRYFLDKYQGIPTNGYEKLVLNQLDSPYITVELETDYFNVQDYFDGDQTIVYTGPIDQFFNYSKGELGWRTLDFEFEELAIDDFQNCAIQNFADIEIPYTRIHEFKHLHPERKMVEDRTVICREYSRRAEMSDEKFYPIRTGADMSILIEYRNLSKKLNNVYFGGRLGSYKYLDMHMAIGQAFELFGRLKSNGQVL